MALTRNPVSRNITSMILLGGFRSPQRESCHPRRHKYSRGRNELWSWKDCLLLNVRNGDDEIPMMRYLRHRTMRSEWCETTPSTSFILLVTGGACYSRIPAKIAKVHRACLFCLNPLLSLISSQRRRTLHLANTTKPLIPSVLSARRPHLMCHLLNSFRLSLLTLLPSQFIWTQGVNCHPQLRYLGQSGDLSGKPQPESPFPPPIRGLQRRQRRSVLYLRRSPPKSRQQLNATLQPTRVAHRQRIPSSLTERTGTGRKAIEKTLAGGSSTINRSVILTNSSSKP